MDMPRRSLTRALLYTVLVVVGATMLLPFVWQILTSFKSLDEVDGAGFWPHRWRPANYPAVFQQIRYGRYYINSLVVAAAVTFLQVLTSSMAAFAFCRVQWKGRDVIFLAYLGTMMVPGVVTMIPNFALMWKLGLYNTYAGLILPAAFSAFGTFMIRQFMLGVPVSLDEAAQLDGATEWQLFWEIILPLVRPAMVTLAIFTFMGNYSSFFWPLIMVKDESLRTLPIGLMYFNSSYGTEINRLMAASVMAIIPLIVVFIVFQRQIVSGLQTGAVKG